MKFIQVFNNYLSPGGEEKSVDRIARHLERGGHAVERFWRSSREWEGAGAPSRLRQLLLLQDNPVVLGELTALHAQFGAEAWILHNVLPVVSLGVYGLARKLRVPVIQWLHNYRPISPSGTLRAGKRDLQPDDPWLVWREIRAGSWRGPLLTAWIATAYALTRLRGDFEAVRAWIAISETMRRVFERAGWGGRRLFALLHAWDTQPLPATPRDEGYWLFLGRLVEPKGVRFLVDLWRAPELADIPLVIAGIGPVGDELRPQSPPNVRWAGHVVGEEKRRLIQGCRGVLVPSLWPEPLGLVAYEGMEAAKPVLASRDGGLVETVQDNVTGRLLPVGQSSEWQRAILNLHHHPETASEWGRSGRRWLERNVSPEAWNARFDWILQQTLEPRFGPSPDADEPSP